jgi:hypothetical protein
MKKNQYSSAKRHKEIEQKKKKEEKLKKKLARKNQSDEPEGEKTEQESETLE